MEFSGDEKRIQALFSELSLEDQSHTPGFDRLWRRAETSAPAPLVRRSVLAFVTAAILVAAVSIATWSWYTSSQSEQAANIPPQTIPTASPVRQPEQLVSINSRELRTSRPRKLVRQRSTGSAAIRQAELLSKWQSPTSTLLNSPMASFLSSLPQLTQSARDLEQFLPKNNDVTKESKQ